MAFFTRSTIALLLFLISTGCVGRRNELAYSSRNLVEIAHSGHQWTGIAVSRLGRIFVTFPRWNESVTTSVGELLPNGTLRAYPDTEWNRWYGSEPLSRFVCVQSVYIDGNDNLWILDSANPRLQGVVKDGIKLIKVDLRSNRVVQIIRFAAPVTHENSYLNDVRVDTRSGHAFITDSGSPGLVVVHLSTGTSWRVLDTHPATTSEDLSLTINGRQWLLPDGSAPGIHADGIALDSSQEYLYLQPLTGRTLYRIALRWLLDEQVTALDLPAKVESLGTTVASDGMEFGPDGSLYFTAIEENAIKRRTPDGTMETVIQDDRLQWPDSLAIAPDGSFYVTTSRVHLGSGPYQLFRFTP